MLWKFNSVYNPELQMADHRRPVTYEMAMPPEKKDQIDPKQLFILPPKGRQGRAIDDATETFVDETRMGTVV
jgi:hopanoid C-3 methylase